MKNKKEGYAYLIHAENLYRFKIGCAINYHKRFMALQSCSPIRLYLIAKKKTKDMYAEERKWHSLFSKKRTRGEWFDLDYKDLIYITKNWKADIGIHWRDRTIDNLKVGDNYFISFDSKTVIPVVLKKIYDLPPHKVIVNSKKDETSWILFDDEVRETEIAALFNRVTM